MGRRGQGGRGRWGQGGRGRREREEEGGRGRREEPTPMAISLAPLHTHCWPSEVTGPLACVHQCCPPCLVCPPPSHGLAALEAFLEVAHCSSDTFLPRPGTQMTQVCLLYLPPAPGALRTGQPTGSCICAPGPWPESAPVGVPSGRMPGPQVLLILWSQSSSTPYSWPTAPSL